jgi:hypothetical protein
MEKTRITNSKEGAAGPEFNKEHANFFDMKANVPHEFVPPNTTVKS